MGDYDYALAVGRPQVQEKLLYLLLGHRVQIAGRLVSEYHGRVIDQGPGYGNPLLLSAGKLRGLVFRPFRQP